MSKFRKRIFLLSLLVLCMAGFAASAGTGISYAPDGKAWTTDDGVTDLYEGEEGETIDFHMTSTRVPLQRGQHYYAQPSDEFNVGKWIIKWPDHFCIHSDYPQNGYHGLTFDMHNACMRPLQPGWFAYCADCGEEIPVLVYSTRDTLSNIKTVNTTEDYYSLCVYDDCRNLEQGCALRHNCKKYVSNNKYIIQYERNGLSGLSCTSIHYYNNSNIYEGEEVTSQLKLSQNQYYRTGLVFTGWNTKVNGTGIDFSDEEDFLSVQEKLNLGYNEDSGIKYIKLYAQSRPAEGTLYINPNGGEYVGETNITKKYCETYVLDSSNITPPDGYTITFNTMGGDPVDSITTQNVFSNWSLNMPFKGVFNHETNEYQFGNLGSTWYDGCSDTITAQYKGLPVTLPTATNSDGSHFGGWYILDDENNEQYFGNAGDEVIINEDTVLYAKWSDLHLDTAENWEANNGKGALDLSWIQNDEADKIFKTYQAKGGENGYDFKQIVNVEAEDSVSVSETWDYTDGSEQLWEVPYSGVYDFTLNGAQGSSQTNAEGGLGGKVSGRVYLKKGEILHVCAGGQDGLGGNTSGGTGDVFGPGGAGSYIWTERLGYIGIAGGGGAATDTIPGGLGGLDSVSELDETLLLGKDGAAGGGGGAIGGDAGVESNIDEKYDYSYKGYVESFKANIAGSYKLEVWGAQGGEGHWQRGGNGGYATGVSNLANEAKIYICVGGKGSDTSGMGESVPGGYNGGGSGFGSDWEGDYRRNHGAGGGATHIATTNKGVLSNYANSTKDVLIVAGGGGGGFCGCHSHSGGDTSWGGSGGGSNGVVTYWDCDLDYPQYPAATTYRFGLGYFYGGGGGWLGGGQVKNAGCGGSGYIGGVTNGSMQNGARSGNGYAIVSFKLILHSASYGGSNYLNPSVYNQDPEFGVNSGNGSVSIVGISLGATKEQNLNGVYATDEEKPNAVSLNKDSKESNASVIKAVWNNPGDNGTLYRHKVASFALPNLTFMMESNVAYDELISGIAGYKYIINEYSDTIITALNGNFQTETSLLIPRENNKKYLHVAAIDKAGNIGDTSSISIEPIGGSIDEKIFYPVNTTPIIISGADNNLYQKDDFYYVKADGNTPFFLGFEGWMDGTARNDYQINYMNSIIDNQTTGNTSTISIFRQCDTADYTNPVDINNIGKGITGEECFIGNSYLSFNRYNDLKNASLKYGSTIDPAYDGNKFMIIPKAGVITGKTEGNIVEYLWSNDADDALNSVTIIADGKIPSLSGNGYEFLKNNNNINRDEYNSPYSLEIIATDEGSGLKEFTLTVLNLDNYMTETFKGSISADGKTASIIIDILKSGILFRGDVAFELRAVDNVGNIAAETQNLGEFSLSTTMTSKTYDENQKSNPTEYKNGESAILVIRTSGYADKIEIKFPDEFAVDGFDTTQEILYSKPVSGAEEYRDDLVRMGIRTEVFEFMIPMSAPENSSYTITITAYKNGNPVDIDYSTETRTLSEQQHFSVKGNIVSDIRTVIITN